MGDTIDGGKDPGRWLAACVLAVSLCQPSGPAWSAACDGVTLGEAVPAQFLRSYRAFFKTPTRLAIDPEDNVYVVDGRNGRLLGRAPSGRVFLDMRSLEYPVSVAVDSAGRLYVGEGKRGRVDVYDPAGQPLGSLGSGEGEFVLPAFIAVHEDAAQTLVYVLDSGADVIRVYDAASGQMRFSFGGTGAAPGQLKFPAGIALTDSKVFVVDRGNSRLQVFDLDGEWVRVITPPPDNCGFLCAFEGATRGRAQDSGVWIGPQGAIYLAEASKGRLLVLSADDGTGLGTVGDYGEGPGRLRAPSDMVIDSCGRLFVASSANGRVDIFGLPGHADPEQFAPARLTVKPDPVDPLVDTELLAYLEVPGLRLGQLSGVTANGFAVPLALEEGDTDGDNIRDMKLVFGPELVSSLIGAEAATVTVTATIGGLRVEASAPVPLVSSSADSDGDGVPDGSDACPGTHLGDPVGSDGCGVAQRCPCAGPMEGVEWLNHGRYVNCVREVAREFEDSGAVARNERGQLVRRAASSSCGRDRRALLPPRYPEGPRLSAWQLRQGAEVPR
jgi:DNA-binding beta-propeller fold protein YncE